ncbi:hypothetical protein GHI93_08040 [Lactococcus hircilactis]|uniref:Uncharacterized protein n=1 Tax=Lactococcus hircilactis TaxID=1494462 RepID=A0A7X1Z9T1_9LACT|nr:hypothetical protein [Lactococcus hircilactis]MQW39874.1 hypothetical protein [Lactococcus hircilactis]
MNNVIFWILVVVGLDLVFALLYASIKTTLKKDNPSRSWLYYFWIGSLGGLFELIFAAL